MNGRTAKTMVWPDENKPTVRAEKKPEQKYSDCPFKPGTKEWDEWRRENHMRAIAGGHLTNEKILKQVKDARKDAEDMQDDEREERLISDIERDGKLSARQGDGKEANPYKNSKEKKAWNKGWKNKDWPDPEAAKVKKETAKTHDDRDLLLLSKGNVAYRMEDMLRRRRAAALSGRHRDCQRLDKEIMLLRAALGMDPLPPEEVVRTHTTGKDPTSRENLVIASTEFKPGHRVKTNMGIRRVGTIVKRQSDKSTDHLPHQNKYLSVKWDDNDKVENYHKSHLEHANNESSDHLWARRVTVGGFAALDKNLRGRGYEYSSEVKGSVITHHWKGFRGAQPDELTLVTIGRDWAAAATRNGHRLDIFNFTQAADLVERGIPLPMTASAWDGRITSEVKQQYARSWAMLNTEA